MAIVLINDETFYRRYLDGDEGGLQALMNRYGNSLTFYIYGYIHDIHDAEDLMIEAFARMILKHPSLKEGCFKAYLYKIGRNLALRFLSKNKLSPSFDLDALWKEPASEILVEDVINTQERDKILHLCMEELNPDYREALYLVYFEDMCHTQVAKIMKKSEKQVSDMLYRGKKSLRKKLKVEGITNAKY